MKDKMELMFLSPYRPELNLIEWLWGWLESSALNNVYFLTLSKVSIAVQKFIRCINKVSTQIIGRLCIRM